MDGFSEMLDKMRRRGVIKARREGRDDPATSATILSLLARLKEEDDARHADENGDERRCRCGDLLRAHPVFFEHTPVPRKPLPE
jgi:hypothetical protein